MFLRALGVFFIAISDTIFFANFRFPLISEASQNLGKSVPYNRNEGEKAGTEGTVRQRNEEGSDQDQVDAGQRWATLRTPQP